MKTAEYWIEKLNLQKHPEGGYFNETYRNNEIIKKDYLPDRYDGDRCFSTLIYFLLKGNEVSQFHKLKSDEILHFYTGSSLTIHILDKEGNYLKILLGSNFEKGEVFHTIIPKGSWFGAEVNDKNSFSLIGCTVTPGFDFKDFEVGEKKKLLSMYPEHKMIIQKLTNCT
jgi:predicted cupin superfamily sugar epimerase